MTKKVSEKARRLKYIAPTFMAGAAVFGVSGAIAGFKAIVHDDAQHHTCHVSGLIQKDDGLVVLLDPDDADDCHPHLKDPSVSGNTLKFVVADSVETYDPTTATLEAGCVLDHVALDNNGQLIVKAEGQCFDSLANIPSTECFVDEDKAYVLNVSYAVPSVCDPEPDINLRAKSITAGNVTVGADVEFRTAKNGTIRLLPPFSVASNHVFRANTDPIS